MFNVNLFSRFPVVLTPVPPSSLRHASLSHNSVCVCFRLSVLYYKSRGKEDYILFFFNLWRFVEKSPRQPQNRALEYHVHFIAGVFGLTSSFNFISL